MRDAHANNAPARPTMCPFCNGTRIDTLAKVITVTTCWRCLHCDKTWTIASLPAAAPPAKYNPGWS